MRFSLSFIVFFQLSCAALHVRHRANNSNKQDIKPLEQHTAPHDQTAKFATHKPPKPVPWWKLPNTNNGEMNALTGQQLRPFNDGDADQSSDHGADNVGNDNVCRIKRCESSGVLNKHYCGQHARCVRDYCQCDFGWKPAGNTPTTRGWTGLEALTVWVDADNAGCTERCDSLSCAEVPQQEGCFGNQVTHKNDKVETTAQDQTDGGELESDALHLGAIKAPGADAGI